MSERPYAVMYSDVIPSVSSVFSTSVSNTTSLCIVWERWYRIISSGSFPRNIHPERKRFLSIIVSEFRSMVAKRESVMRAKNASITLWYHAYFFCSSFSREIARISTRVCSRLRNHFSAHIFQISCSRRLVPIGSVWNVTISPRTSITMVVWLYPISR